MKNFNKEILVELYENQKLNPYEIGNILNANHKTIRRYIKLYGIQMRTANEYNYLPKASHFKPLKETLFSPLSIGAHTAYLCEGWHTEKSASFYFCNTDPALIDMQIRFLKEVYRVKAMRLVIYAKSIEQAKHLKLLYPEAKFYLDESRKTPIVRLYSGGKTLVRDIVQNAYIILNNL